MQTKLLRNNFFLLTVFLFFSQAGVAQLSPFVLQVTATNESCTANGLLNFTASNTTTGATIIYKIYSLPDTTTPIAVTSLNSFTGLTAGNYRVVATQSLGSETNVQQQDATILNVIDPLDYNVTAEPAVCGNDGKITVYVTNGNPVAYEIFSGPVLRPLQTSNVFANLPGGTYMVRVFDNCGEGLASVKTINEFDSLLTFPNGIVSMNGCNNFWLNVLYAPGPNSNVAQPVSLQITVNPPVGPPLVFNYPTSGTNTILSIPAYFTGNYTYSVVGTNRCGETYSRNNIPILPPSSNPSVSWSLSTWGCSYSSLSLSTDDMVSPITFTFTFPPGFNLDDYTNNPNSTYFFNPSLPLPNGNYTVTATDACGHTATDILSVALATHTPGNVSGQNNPGCQVGYGSLQIAGQYGLVSIELLNAPSNYIGTVPFDFTSMITSNIFYFGLVPPGAYLFKTVDTCGDSRTTTINVTGYQSGATTTTITDNCNSFNLNLNHSTNSSDYYTKYYLQKRNAQNQWGHPGTGNVGTPGILSSLNSVGLINGNNNGLEYSGYFRIVKTTDPFYTGNVQMPKCFEVLYEFEYTSGPKILDVYSFVCENSTYDAIVVATGFAPLIYRITTKNGQPFLVNNGASNIFVGLEPAIYSFQIEDSCGNILNSLFDISNPSVLAITPQGFCSGQTAKLSVPVFPFLDYRWWKGNGTSNILSTTNELVFTSFNPVTDNGLYHVRIFYEGNPNSCIDFVIDYQINISPNAPNAGNGATATYCGSPGTVDLFSILSGTFDTNGTWQEMTNSGTLTNNLWNASAIDSGDYEFRYTVTGSCNTADQSTVNIQIKPMPEMPIAFLEQAVCDTKELYLLATQIPFGTYQWSGPNGFTSNEQNPVINNISAANNGTYSVKSVANGCESGESSVAVLVNALPNVAIESACVGNQYTIKAVPVANAFDISNVSYAWSGPQNFTSTDNPVVVTGIKGIFTVTVTSSEGCTAKTEVDVLNPFCSIPTGISPNDDGNNDYLNLVGYDVLKFKIFNRHGRMVFEQDDYTDQWHGQDFKGRTLPDATYYYYLKFKSGEEKTGWVYVTK